ncbi:DUF4291 family protein [Streptantibioticus rubrisoli]|uniref:DUF4291 domain-containing protein n=1 Tax=Streptantibioticus rubrisoli TaxID=1387313 RepID=A0ABT1P7R5_9ACTN|nr:DUF4291 family protein [Streptantibioticus rubrisoli]MCQ4041414.1 DUF4291 domain-containing protein [Streptantibioticus rubrisoli]
MVGGGQPLHDRVARLLSPYRRQHGGSADGSAAGLVEDAHCATPGTPSRCSNTWVTLPLRAIRVRPPNRVRPGNEPFGPLVCPERSPRGAALNHYSVQVGIGRHLIRTFNDDWIVSLTDLTPGSARPRH